MNGAEWTLVILVFGVIALCAYAWIACAAGGCA